MSTVTCPKCGKSFNNPNGLAMHVQTVHPKGQIISRKNKKRILYSLLILGAIAAIWAIFLAMPSEEDRQRQQAQEKKDVFVVKLDDWTYGNPNASVVLIEYLDFECEACRAYYPLIKDLKREYGDNVLFVIRYYPLPGHPNSVVAARAAEAAGQQGKFWELHDKLYDTQNTWGERKQDNDIFFAFAQQAGVDMVQFEKDFERKETRARVERDRQQGTLIGVSGTPSFFLNGVKLRNPKTLENFKTVLDAAILQAPVVQPPSTTVHEHADIKVYLNGEKLDLSQDKYQTLEKKYANGSIEKHANETVMHLHDGNPNIVHKHERTATLEEFFSAINITFSSSCFILDNGENYYTSDEKTLKLFVNGKANSEYEKYSFRDDDSILITYGALTNKQITEELASLTDDACMYSETCPERGKPPTEGCVGGLGSECT